MFIVLAVLLFVVGAVLDLANAGTEYLGVILFAGLAFFALGTAGWASRFNWPKDSA